MSVLFGRISVYSICKGKSKWEISLPNSKYYCSTFRAVKSDENGQGLQYYTEFKKLVKAQNVMCKDGYTCFHVSCKICLNNEHTWAYINKRTGSFICPNCDVILPLYVAKDAYENKKKVVDRKANLIQAYNTKCKNLKPIEIDVCKNLHIKGLTPTDFELLQAGHDEALNILYFPLKDANGRVVGEKWLSLRDFTEETHQSSICSGILVHGDPTKHRAVLVSNILDFLALIAARIVKYCIVCLPYGLKTLPQECLPNLEHFKELVLWYKYDSPSWGAAKAFAAKLDEKRCQLIKPTDTEPCPYEALRKNLNIQHILQRATPVRHHSITTFSSLRNDILCELQNIEKVHGVKWKRFPILNKLLKGHRKGELTIITGPTGSGKTTFMSEYSLDLALQGVSTLWGSFEIRNSRLAATLLRQFVGYSLEKKLNEFDRWSAEFEKYPMFFMTFHGQQPLKVVLDAIEHAHYVHDINHVIIDNLQFMMGISNTYRTDKFWEQDNIVAAFRSLATKRNVHITLVMHPRKERDEEDLTTNSIFGSAKASQEADNVLIIQDKRLTSLRGKKYLQVVKNRYSGDLGIMPLEFNKEALSYAQSGSKKRKDKDKESTKLTEDLTISVT